MTGKAEAGVNPVFGNRQIILFLGIVSGAICLYEGVIEPYILPRIIAKNWGVVEEGKVYRSGQLSSALVEKVLKKYGIGTIIALNCPDNPTADQLAEARAAERLGIERLELPLRGDGSGDIQNYVDGIVALVNARCEGKPVLVHCAAGVMRTGGLIAYYRLLVKKDEREEILQELERYGCHEKRQARLLPYLNRNMQTLAEALHARGVIDEMSDPVPML